VIAADTEAARQKIAAEAAAVAALKEAEAMVTIATAVAKMVEAENALALKFVLRDVAFRAIDRLPEVARELMEPAKAIREIKVLQTGGFAGGGNGASQPMLGVMSPILKSILEAGAAYPLLRELMQFAKADSKTLTDKAQAALDELSTEIGDILKKEEGKNGGGASAGKPHDPIEVEVLRRDVPRGVGE
jgi:flotillin